MFVYREPRLVMGGAGIHGGRTDGTRPPAFAIPGALGIAGILGILGERALGGRALGIGGSGLLGLAMINALPFRGSSFAAPPPQWAR